MAAHVEAAANTAPGQKARINAVVAQATTDLHVLHGQAGQFHQHLHAALTRDVVDRVAAKAQATHAAR
jgi:hypothetical protein